MTHEGVPFDSVDQLEDSTRDEWPALQLADAICNGMSYLGCELLLLEEVV